MPFKRYCLFVIVLGILLVVPPTCHAEVVLDGTLGPSGPVPGPTDYIITDAMGRIEGENLFHSFTKFSIDKGESATFTGPDTIDNIIGRVTGGESSWIDGILRSEIPGADLFLINPWGIMFGKNATLDIKGSFHASTADYLRLGNTGRYSATKPETSVLTSDPPTAFGFLDDTPADISIFGSRCSR